MNEVAGVTNNKMQETKSGNPFDCHSKMHSTLIIEPIKQSADVFKSILVSWIQCVEGRKGHKQ